MTAFAELAALGRRLERSRGRLDKRREVAAFLRVLDPEEVPIAVAFLAGRPFPTSDPRVLGVRGLGRGAAEIVSPDEPSAAEVVASLREINGGITEEQVRQRYVLGTPDQVVAGLRRLLDRHVNHLIISHGAQPSTLWSDDIREVFGKEVLPVLKAA